MLRGRPRICWIAWAAGLIDGEGSIGLYRDRGRKTYAVTIRVSMTHRDTVERLQEIFRTGSVNWRPPRGHRKSAYSWFCGSRGAAEWILVQLRPFLVTKAIEADLALRFLQDAETLSSREKENLYFELRREKCRPGPGLVLLRRQGDGPRPSARHATK